MSTEKTVIEGKYTDATIFLPEEEIEDVLYDQIEKTVNHPAFTNPIRVMSDAHWGAGCAIGFTMPLNNRVCPNTVGVDIACGMYAFMLDSVDLDVSDNNEVSDLDTRIRENVPMGMEVNKDNVYHIKNDFPWDEVNRKWNKFAKKHLDDIDFGEYHPDKFEYDNDYFKELCRRVGADINRAIASLGSLGSGNHFIELGKSSDDEIWGVIHSGSRGLGYNIAEYHQNRAEEIRNLDSTRKALINLRDPYCKYIKPNIDSVSDEELHKWIHNRQIVDYEKLKDEFANTENANLIEQISNVINSASRGQFSDVSKYIEDVNVDELEAMEEASDLAYLEGKEAVEYYVDMAFAQMYASESRKKMARGVEKATGGKITDTIESVHNYIDYEDGVMRKGATPARDGQRGIIPMNMSFGSFVVIGKGNDKWNNSAPHGAGRVMSRTQAHEELDENEFKEQMGDTFASEMPLDEAPMAYKDVSMIEKAMNPTVEIVDRVEPFLNLKAE